MKLYLYNTDHSKQLPQGALWHHDYRDQNNPYLSYSGAQVRVKQAVLAAFL